MSKQLSNTSGNRANSVAGDVAEKLRRSRHRLLDLTLRNRLLNFRPGNPNYRDDLKNHNHVVLKVMPFGNSKVESQRDSDPKPRVARNELPATQGCPALRDNPGLEDSIPLGLSECRSLKLPAIFPYFEFPKGIRASPAA